MKDAQINIKEVDISNNDQPKMVTIEDYWTEQQTTDINILLKGYQDVFPYIINIRRD